MQSRLYWTLRYGSAWLQFNVASRRFAVARALESTVESAAILGTLSRSVSLSILFAAGLAFFLLLVIEPRLPTNLFRLKLNAQAYVGLLEAVASVTGVFLALYFAAVSTVAGATFARLPNDVRSLVVREKVGNVYVNFLSLLVVFSLVLLGIRAFGLPPLRTGVVVIVILVAPAVFAFARLGQRAFYFFDPTALADVLFADLQRLARLATPNGYRWQDQSFQEHYRTQANQAIRTLSTLVGFARKEEALRGRSFVALVLKSVWYLEDYFREKRRIPSDSRWFELVPKYQEWYLADSIGLDLATTTMTPLPPKMEPNQYWLEDSMLDIVEDAWKETLTDETLGTATQILQAWSDLAGRLGEEWEVSYARRRIEGLFTQCLERITKGVATRPEIIARTDQALVERLALLPTQLELGLVKTLDTFRLPRLETDIKGLAWDNRAAIYSLVSAPGVKERLEYLSVRLTFEGQAEGVLVSPHWYQLQLIHGAIAERLHENLIQVLDWLRDFYESGVTSLLQHQTYPEAAIFCSRGLEATGKMLYHLHRLRTLEEALGQARVLPDLPWPDFRWDEWQQRLEEVAARLHEGLAKCIPELAGVPGREDSPDILGEAVHRVGQACFESISGNKPQLFQRLFPPYFVGIITIVERLREKVAEFGFDRLAPFLVEPIMDLVSLSGYAYAWSDFHQNTQLWSVARGAWDTFLTDKDGKSRLEFLAAAIRYGRGLFALTPRDMLRARWQMALDNAIRALPRRLIKTRRGFGVGEVPDHPSELIRQLGISNLGSMHRGDDIFVSVYLRTRPDTAQLDFGRDFLTDSLKRTGEVDDDEEI
jgi:hypothetical protein